MPLPYERVFELFGKLENFRDVKFLDLEK